jgi:hypothetical protein
LRKFKFARKILAWIFIASKVQAMDATPPADLAARRALAREIRETFIISSHGGLTNPVLESLDSLLTNWESGGIEYGRPGLPVISLPVSPKLIDPTRTTDQYHG